MSLLYVAPAFPTAATSDSRDFGSDPSRYKQDGHTRYELVALSAMRGLGLYSQTPELLMSAWQPVRFLECVCLHVLRCANAHYDVVVELYRITSGFQDLLQLSCFDRSDAANLND